MAKAYELKIQSAHNDEEMWVYSKGHHPVSAFIDHAKTCGYQKAADEDEGYQLEQVRHEFIRSVPTQEGSMLWPAAKGDRGAFPVTISLCYWHRTNKAAKQGEQA